MRYSQAQTAPKNCNPRLLIISTFVRLARPNPKRQKTAAIQNLTAFTTITIRNYPPTPTQPVIAAD